MFNQTVFDTTLQYWTADPLTPQMLADGKLFRQIVSRSTNPNYTFTSSTEAFSLGEVAAPIIVLGDMTAGTVNKSFTTYLFGKCSPLEGKGKPCREAHETPFPPV